MGNIVRIKSICIYFSFITFSKCFISLGENIAARAEKSPSKTLLVLADRRVPGGDLMKLADVARRSGITRILFAGKNADSAE